MCMHTYVCVVVPRLSTRAFELQTTNDFCRLACLLREAEATHTIRRHPLEPLVMM
jgi:hypothetical protein